MSADRRRPFLDALWTAFLVGGAIACPVNTLMHPEWSLRRKLFQVVMMYLMLVWAFYDHREVSHVG